MFEFVGILMGISLRTKATLPFSFPSFVWKGVINQKREWLDLESTDLITANMVKAITSSHIVDEFTGEQVPINEELFDANFSSTTFTITDIAGQVVELIPGGLKQRVTFHNRFEYAAKVRKFKLGEVATQINAIKRGFACIVPLRIMQLFTWQQVEVLVAGEPDIDVDYLREHTEYRGYKPTDEVIKRFWRVLSSLSASERSMFVRFVWGRSRLPLKGRSWPQTFKIQKATGVDDTHLPVTHTCFFSIELPAYSSEEIMREKLLAAINFGVGGILNA
jgi:hypothetical protein